MGAGASSGLSAGLSSATDADLVATIAGLSRENRDKLTAALGNKLIQKTPPAAELIRLVHSGEKACVAIMKEAFERIKEVDGDLNSCVEVLEKSALEAAAEVDAKVAKGEKLRPLEGLPLLVKANIDVAGTLSTASTPAFKDWRPKATAPCMQKLLDAGVIPVAKTNMPEFALRMDGWNYVHGMCRNPHSLEHSPGGSSSGTAAAVASGMAPVGLGSDTSGSTRIPAACCGIAGFRPSRGRWPGEGVVPIDSRKDTVGPMGGCVADLALLDAIVTGEEQVQPVNLKGIQVSVPQDWIDSFNEKGGFDDAPRQALEEAVATLKKAGAIVDNKPDFYKVVEMRPQLSACDSAQDLENYLSLHKDRPEEVSRAKVVELTENPGIKFLFGDTDPEKQKAKVQEVDESIEKTEAAYREYFKEHGLQAILVPALQKEPYVQKQDEPPASQDMFAVAGLSGRLTEVKCPSVAIPTNVKHVVGGGSLPAGVMLFGVDDRHLLSIALSLEKAFQAA